MSLVNLVFEDTTSHTVQGQFITQTIYVTTVFAQHVQAQKSQTSSFL